MRKAAAACVLASVLAGALDAGAAEQEPAPQRAMPPAWPYAQPQLSPGVMPPQVAATRPPAVAAGSVPAPARPDAASVLLRAAGSRFQFTQQEISNSYAPADWFPEDHPPMPPTVGRGKPGIARACALCHLPDGRGRPENAPVQGLAYDYIVQQLHDFQQGLRRSAEPRKANTPEMEGLARTLDEGEIRDAARYFSSMRAAPVVRVVETADIPAMRIQGEIYYPAADGRTEPIGVRIIETPEDAEQVQVRNPRARYIAYVPVGSVARGARLAAGRSDELPACASCHGAALQGMGLAPAIAGRSPSYLARQMYDMKIGTRHGPNAALMRPLLAQLEDAAIVDVIAYVASLTP